MAHLEHKLSYSRYRLLLEAENLEKELGSNHKDIHDDAECIFLGEEFAAVVLEFATTIRSKVLEAEPYSLDEFDDVLTSFMEKSNEGISAEDLKFLRFYTPKSIKNVETVFHFQSLLFLSMIIGDYRMVKSLLRYCPQYSPMDCKWDHSHGQAYSGGFAQVFGSFFSFYLLINTCCSYDRTLSEIISRFHEVVPAKLQSASMEAFSYGCWEFNDWMGVKFRRMKLALDIPSPKFSNKVDYVEMLGHERFTKAAIKEISKEMFRLMYWAVALCFLREETTESFLREARAFVLYEFFIFRFNNKACRLVEMTS